MSSLKRIINVPHDEVQMCFRFAEELYFKEAASLKQFGRTDLIREKNDFISDHVIGKVVEFGFRYFLEENFNTSFVVDLEVWEDQLIHDNGNDLATVIINGQEREFIYKTDIKGSRSSSKWLLVEKHKLLNFDTKFYIIGRLNSIPDGKEFEANPYSYIQTDWQVEILGYALNKDLVDKKTKKGWIEYYSGDRLLSPSILKRCRWKNRELTHKDFQSLLHKTIDSVPADWSINIGPILDCKVNFGVPISWLRNDDNDWEKFNEIIKRNSFEK